MQSLVSERRAFEMLTDVSSNSGFTVSLSSGCFATRSYDTGHLCLLARNGHCAIAFLLAQRNTAVSWH